MKILVSNDDGYFAPGITLLAEALRQLGEVTVVAPERDRSGASNSLTLDRPQHVTRVSNPCAAEPHVQLILPVSRLHGDIKEGYGENRVQRQQQ